MPENGTTDIKVQLAGLKQEIENINSIHNRLDTAIDKLTDVSTSIKSMLAVHEEKLSQSEKIDEVIFTKIRERADEIERVNRELTDHINMTEKRLLNEIKSLRNDIGPRINVLEKWKWVILGGSIVVGWVLSRNFIHIMQMINGS
tara:strand:+ start:879 stop:1313 length:435 start_codon:yes stop_codon:yes gene_type:complete